MTPEQLKASILQYAIKGKLVEQRPEEGTAEDLYKSIQIEKQKLIREGKIKKEKPLAEITEDEMPFDIPDSWKWVRISTIGITQTGNTPKKSHPEYFGSDIPFLGPGYIQNVIIYYENQGLSDEGKEYGRITPANSILQVCIGGSIGKCALVDREVAFNQQINSIYPLIANSEYVYHILDSSYFKNYMKDNAGGTATPIINRGLWDAIVIPLPPLAEQHRIVAKIEELLPFVDRYAASYEKLEQFNAKFPEDMKKSILQYAIQGKLVEQRPDEGTAEEDFVIKCKEDKEKSIIEGKYRKESYRGKIVPEDVPFEIPDSWMWMYISDMSLFQEGPGILGKDFRTQGIPLIRIAGMQGDEVSLAGCNYLDPQMVCEKWEHFKLDYGDIVISTSASMDKIAEVKEEAVGAIPYTGLIRFKMYGGISKEYFKWFIRSSFYMSQVDNQKSGGTIKHYGPTHLKQMIVPIPPLEEQNRIVAKIEELLPYCDQLLK